MSLFRKQHKTNQRKYIDLIKGSSENWVNWLAPKNIHAGDFGTVDKITGELFVEGNIYTHEEIANIAMKYPATGYAEDDLFEIHSKGVLPSEVKIEARAAEGVLFESQWQFNSKRGAVLLMYKPRITRVPDGFFSESARVPILKNKRVVYQAWDCPGYFMYLSGKVSEKVSVSLRWTN